MLFDARSACIILCLITSASAVTHSQTIDWPAPIDESLRVYAVNVVHSRPFKEPFIGLGIYLGRGYVITAAHVLGRWPFFISSPRILVAGKELPAKVLKSGSFETTDLALLSVDQALLPSSLQLRRNPLCTASPKAGENVMVVAPYATTPSRISFPQSLPNAYTSEFETFIKDEGVSGISGSGVFHAQNKCLLGIVSSRVSRERFTVEKGHKVRDLARSVEVAKHFVPASTIAEFIESAMASKTRRPPR